jgi:molybdopterin synthase catalytic subunit
MNYLKLTFDKLNPTEISEIVARESCGAISMFAGTTRDNFENKEVISLEYEAYEPMAIKEMTRICDETRKKWKDIEAIAIYHRLGLVPVKEISIFIAISSPHRQASLEALPFMIDSLKMSVPIWKRECYKEEGESQWKENPECTWSNKNKAG